MWEVIDIVSRLVDRLQCLFTFQILFLVVQSDIYKLIMEVVSLRRNRIKKNIIMSTVSKPYIIFVSLLFLLLSIYPFYVLFLYPMFQFLSIFVPFDPSYVVIPFSIFTYVYIMYEVFYNRRSILCWSRLFHMALDRHQKVL